MDETDIIVDYLKQGKIILYPTDTVWGIGCDATDFNAVQRIFSIKQRDERKSFVVLVDSIEMLISIVSAIPSGVLHLIQESNLPTTVIYSNPKGIAPNVIAENNSLAIRIVNDAFCKNFIHKLGKPIVSTSANKSGEKTPAFYNEISDEIKNQMDYIVQHRREDVQPQKPSTILKIDENNQILTIRA
jgi:L-threonylcarbamoyladenylate synthase